jgi:hypothetical protein
VAKVLLGRVIEHGSEIPQRRPAWTEKGYHSRSGTERDMQFLLADKWRDRLIASGRWPAAQRIIDSGREYGMQYIVHCLGQAYPAYLVTYTNPHNP